MGEFQWWLLIAGLVAGGTVVGLLTASFSRTDADLGPDEREAEAAFIARHLTAGGESGGQAIDPRTVARVLEAHREYLGLPAPIAIVPAGGSAADRHPDEEADDVGDAGSGAADRDLADA